MKFMNLIKYRRQDETTGDNQGTPPANEGGKDNTANNIDDFSNLWHNSSNPTGNEGEPVQQVHIVNQPAEQELTPQQKLSAHITGLELTGGVDMQALANPETAQVELDKLAANIYSSSMRDANNIIDQRMETMRTEMMQSTADTMKGNEQIGVMNKALPYTSKAEYRPVAENALANFLSAGKSLPEAVELVGKYFQQISNDVTSSLPVVPNSGRGGRPFAGNQNTNDSNSGNADPEDWMSFMSAKPK